jgi:hypothetical protein
LLAFCAVLAVATHSTGRSGRPMRIEHEYFREGASGPIWRPGTSITPSYSVAVRTKAASPRPTASWLRS